MDQLKPLDTWKIFSLTFNTFAQARAALGPDAPAVDVCKEAWLFLKYKLRGDPWHRFDQDYKVAAAEHYMYIRFLPGKTGDPYCYVGPVLYSAKKLYDQLTGNLQKGQAQPGHPILPAHPAVVAWGMRGVKDGLWDFKKANRGADYKYGAAVEDLAGFPFSKDTAKEIGRYASDPVQFIKESTGPYESTQ
jgi:hypothetical protein